MFNDKKRKSILKYYNEFYEGYFEGINKDHMSKISKFFREKILRKSKSDLMGLKEMHTNIHAIYYKMIEFCLKYNKVQLKNSIDSLSKRDSSNFIILIITIGFTFGITYYTFMFNIDLQNFYTCITQSRENINKIEDSRSRIKEINTDIKKEKNENQINLLKSEREKELNTISKLSEDNDSNLKSFKSSSDSLDKIILSCGKYSIYAFFIFFIFITLFSGMYKEYKDKSYDNKKSFLLFCLYILEEVQDEKLKELEMENIKVKKEIVETYSNEAKQKLSIINSTIDEVESKVEDLKKFYNI